MRTLLLAFLLISLAAVPATAAVPNPATSTVPRCLTVCPAGDVSFVVTVRDAFSVPLAGSVVKIIVANCSGIHLCQANGTEPYTFDVPTQSFTAVTNAAGVATFPIRAGGTCTGGVPVTADGVLLATLAGISSPDQDSDLFVSAADILTVNAKVGLPDVTADFDCDGLVTNNDVLFAQNHGTHSCERPTPTHRNSWGNVKLIYR